MLPDPAGTEPVTSRSQDGGTETDNLHGSHVAKLRFKLTSPGSAVRRTTEMKCQVLFTQENKNEIKNFICLVGTLMVIMDDKTLHLIAEDKYWKHPNLAYI